MNRLVIYQKNDTKWEDLIEVEETEEGEILEERSRLLELEETQTDVIQFHEPSMCKEIVPFKEGPEEEGKSERKDPK